MKAIFASAAILASLAGSAMAADPIGDWRVKDGYANIRIDNCAGKMWGVVVWEKEAGLDVENPDPAKKGRPTLGMPILLGMKQTKPNLWEGEIYNSNNGKTYSANISMVNDNTLKLEGCVLGGIFCGGENWTRVMNPAPLPPPAQTKAPPPKGQTKGAPAGAPLSEVCARVATEFPPPPSKGAANK